MTLSCFNFRFLTGPHQRRQEVLLAEETIRKLAVEMKGQSEMPNRFDAATNILSDSRNSLQNATNLLQQGVLAVDGTRTKLTETGVDVWRQLVFSVEFSYCLYIQSRCSYSN